MPPPPVVAGAVPRLSGGRIWAGVVLALGGHCVVVLATAVLGLTRADPQVWTSVGIGGELALLAASTTAGVRFILRSRKDFGIGLLVGWAGGAVAIPIVGFGMLAGFLLLA